MNVIVRRRLEAALLESAKTALQTRSVSYHTVVEPSSCGGPADAFQDEPASRTRGRRPNPTQSQKETRLREFTTLKQACSSEYQGAQDAFKDSMIH
jgi:hypothetical protein